MALKDTIPFGIALPHRFPDPIDVAVVRHVAQRVDDLGFSDMWVKENTLNHVFCFDALVLLIYAAAVTTTIRLGVSMMVLPIHHTSHTRWPPLDYLSNGRAVPRGWSRPGSPLHTVPGFSRTSRPPTPCSNWKAWRIRVLTVETV